jgi:hypothetical protein
MRKVVESGVSLSIAGSSSHQGIEANWASKETAENGAPEAEEGFHLQQRPIDWETGAGAVLSEEEACTPKLRSEFGSNEQKHVVLWSLLGPLTYPSNR